MRSVVSRVSPLRQIAAFLADPGAWPVPVDGAAFITASTLFYPPDPTETTAQLGGTIATNASGARSFRFGPTRQHVLELQIVLADGDTLVLRRGICREKNGIFTAKTEQGNVITIPKPSYRSPAVKNASGYFSSPGMDLIDLFIGSEGTLGILAKCTVRLMAQPSFAAGLTFFPDRNAAFGAAAFLRAEPMVSAIEYFDHTALAFLETARKELPFDLPAFPGNRRNAVYWEYLESENASGSRARWTNGNLRSPGSALPSSTRGAGLTQRKSRGSRPYAMLFRRRSTAPSRVTKGTVPQSAKSRPTQRSPQIRIYAGLR